MTRFALRDRVLPAIVTALGIAIVAAGLMTYPFPSSASGSVSATPTPPPSDGGSIIPGSTIKPGASAVVGGQRVASRVVVPALRIDLPVIAPPETETFPYCEVAEYLRDFGQPGDTNRTTFIYAHARPGNFLPLLDRSQVRNGASLVGMIVQVYTNDYRLYLYEITDVYRHQDSLSVANTAPGGSLILQTSEGPRRGEPGYTGLVLMILARPLGSSASEPALAVPVPRPVACS